MLIHQNRKVKCISLFEAARPLMLQEIKLKIEHFQGKKQNKTIISQAVWGMLEVGATLLCFF